MLRTISHIRLVILVPLALLVAVFAASAATAAPPIKAPKPDKDTAKAGQALGLSGAPTAGVKIQVHEAKFSRKELLDAADQVTRDAQALGQQQVTVEAVGPKVDGSGIDVTVFAADGGDRITDFSVGCSSGFAATYNGAPAMLTAAHCGGVGGYWYNGPGTTGGHRHMGQVGYRDGRT